MSLHVQKMKPSRRIPAWQCIQKIACLKAIITISHLCHGFGFTVAPSLQTLPPPALQIIGEDRTSIFSFKDDSVPIISSSSSFQSIALSWLDQEEALPTQSASSTIFLSSLLVTTEESSTTTPADASDSAASSTSWSNQILNAKSSKTDKVKRIIDASTIQLEKGGYVSLESVRGAGSTYRLPDCMTFGPSYKLRKLLPKGTAVRYVVGLDENNNAKSSSAASSSSSSSTTPRVWIIRDKDQILINQELVKSGFAFVRKGTKAPPGMMDDLMKLERSAKQQGLGIYKSCNAEEESGEGSGLSSSSSSDITATFVAEFEPLDFTTEIHYGDDGGKSVVVPRKESSSSSTPPPPSNPGDIKGCSDFRTYEESLRWYETYFPYYGDVARLDRDGDGVPCPGLPHTTVGEKYRMKAPNAYAKKAS